jgi:glutathione S-transferase
MKLFYAAASPYARKVLLVLDELGFMQGVELVPAAVLPTSHHAAVTAANPLGKVPTLVLDDGTALYDSRVIAEYLDVLGGGRLIPAAGPARWSVLRQQATADGLLDATLLMRYEQVLRPADKQWPDWVAGQTAKVRRALDSLEAEIGDPDRPIDLGRIAVGCALEYLDFRFPDEPWRDGRSGLAAFDARFRARPSCRALPART